MVTEERLRHSDWITLSDGERLAWAGRPSVLTILPRVVVGVALFVVGLVLPRVIWPFAASRFGSVPPDWFLLAPLSLSAVGIGYAAFVFLRWVRLLYVVTNEEIYVKRGLVSRDVSQIRLSRVQNTTLRQSVLERFLSYGDVTVFTAGSDTMDIELRDVPNPQEVTRVLTDLLSEEDAASRGARRQQP